MRKLTIGIRRVRRSSMRNIRSMMRISRRLRTISKTNGEAVFGIVLSKSISSRLTRVLIKRELTPIRMRMIRKRGKLIKNTIEARVLSKKSLALNTQALNIVIVVLEISLIKAISNGDKSTKSNSNTLKSSKQTSRPAVPSRMTTPIQMSLDQDQPVKRALKTTTRGATGTDSERPDSS